MSFIMYHCISEEFEREIDMDDSWLDQEQQEPEDWDDDNPLEWLRIED